MKYWVNNKSLPFFNFLHIGIDGLLNVKKVKKKFLFFYKKRYFFPSFDALFWWVGFEEGWEDVIDQIGNGNVVYFKFAICFSNSPLCIDENRKKKGKKLPGTLYNLFPSVSMMYILKIKSRAFSFAPHILIA